MSRRMPSNVAPGPALRLAVRSPHGQPRLSLEDADIAELRRSVAVVRCMVERRLATSNGKDVVNGEDRSVHPPADEAARFSPPGAFLPSSRSGSSLYVAWMQLCNATAADLLDDPAVGVQAFGGDPDTDAQALLDLLDEIEERLDRLAPPY